MQQLLTTAQQIMEVLNQTTVAVAKVEQDTPTIRENLSNFRQLERLALRYLVLARRMGLPDEIGGAVSKISQIIVMFRMLTMSINLMLATNPVTFLIGVAGIAGTALTIPSLVEGY